MTLLDKIVALAGLLEPDELGGSDRAHGHLLKQCPWYAAVLRGEDAVDPAGHCPSGRGEMVRLTPRTPEASTVVKPTVPPGGPGLFHVKGLHLPPYMEHLYFHLVKRYGRHKAYQVANGIVHKWAAGINPGGRHPTKTHADVKAAAARNVAEWEKDKAAAHAQSRGHVRAAGGEPQLDRVVSLAGVPAGSATAPGAKPIPPKNFTDYGLYQKPSQTTAASPPLPPGVPLPTAAEMRKIAGQVPDCTDGSLSQSARVHLEGAAVKLEKDDVLGALHVLRTVQSDIYAAHKADLGIAMPAVYTANVFTRVAPAEVSSANAAMIESRDRAMLWRKLEQQVAIAIDKIRRRFYHGSYGGIMQQGRFTGPESPLDKVLRLNQEQG